MSAATTRPVPNRLRIGWGILLVLSTLSALGHLALIFIQPDLVDSFIAWSAFSAYSVAILAIPYRRGERWAWAATWLLPIPFSVLGLNSPDAAPYYLAAAGLMISGQLLTRDSFSS